MSEDSLEYAHTKSTVQLETTDNLGIITLKRDKAMNALTEAMMAKVLSVLRLWQKNKKAIIITGHNNFSSGGDIKSVWAKDFRGPENIYNVINEIGNSNIPVVTIMAGVTMGAGLGTAVFAKFRVATDSSVAAMPEVKIGMLPDAGGSYFLSRLKYNLGLYMGLTGTSIKGIDVYRSGLATHYVPRSKLHHLQQYLSACEDAEEVEQVLAEHSENDAELPLVSDIQDVEYCFGGKSVEEILERLQEINNDWSRRTIRELRTACPGSVKIAFQSLRLGRHLDLWRCLQMDYALVYWSLRNHDFREGVRATLYEKDRQPKWKPSSLEQVTHDYVNSFFKELPKGSELKVLPIKLAKL